MMARPLRRFSTRPASATYRLSGPFTVETAPRVMKALLGLHRPELRFVFLDLTDVDEVDSSALATLLWGFHHMSESPMEVEITGAPAKLGALLELYNMEKMFRLSHS